jgi:hypothetical protein
MKAVARGCPVAGPGSLRATRIVVPDLSDSTPPASEGRDSASGPVQATGAQVKVHQACVACRLTVFSGEPGISLACEQTISERVLSLRAA